MVPYFTLVFGKTKRYFLDGKKAVKHDCKGTQLQCSDIQSILYGNSFVLTEGYKR